MFCHKYNPGRGSVLCGADDSNLFGTEMDESVTCNGCIAILSRSDAGYHSPRETQRRRAVQAARVSAEQQLAGEEQREREAAAAARQEKIDAAARSAGEAFDALDAAVKAAPESPAAPESKGRKGKGGEAPS